MGLATGLAQSSVLGLPRRRYFPGHGARQLGLGATYYASNANNTNAAAAFLKQGFLRYQFDGADKNLRLGRFEYIDGQETQPKDAVIAWLQANRVAHRLIGKLLLSGCPKSQLRNLWWAFSDEPLRMVVNRMAESDFTRFPVLGSSRRREDRWHGRTE